LFLLAANKMGLENITNDKEVLEKDIECLDDNEESYGILGLMHDSVSSALFFGGAIMAGYVIYQAYMTFTGR
jgi:hypothetical protein